MYLGPDQPSTDHRAVEYCLLRRSVLLPFDKHHERVRRIGAGDFVPRLELNDRAVIERLATENCGCERARDITARDPHERWKDGDPLRECHFDGGPATGLRLRAHTSDARGRGWRKGLAAARGGEDAETDKRVSHGATPFNRNLNRPCKI